MADIMTGLDQSSIRKSDFSRRVLRDIVFNPLCARLADAVWVDYLKRHWQFEACGRVHQVSIHPKYIEDFKGLLKAQSKYILG